MIAIDLVRRAMLQPLPGPAAQRLLVPNPRNPGVPMPAHYRAAAVLLLLYPLTAAPAAASAPAQGEGADLCLALTRRTDHLAAHAGQISLPGGLREPDDPSLAATALREAREELGPALGRPELLGPLTPLEIPVSAYRVYPWVAYLPARPAFRPDPSEVAELIEVPLDLLLDPASLSRETRTIRGVAVDVPYYLVYGHKVWGATAAVLAEFIALLRRVL